MSHTNTCAHLCIHTYVNAHAELTYRLEICILYVITIFKKISIVNKLIYHTIEYYSALKRNELSSQEKTWGKLECVITSERGQSESTTLCDCNYMCDMLEKQNYTDGTKISGCQGSGGSTRISRAARRQSTEDT